MTYLQELHERRKERLGRMAAAAVAPELQRWNIKRVVSAQKAAAAKASAEKLISQVRKITETAWRQRKSRERLAKVIAEEVSRGKFSFSAIIAVVAQAHGVSVADIKGPSRKQRIVNARMHVIATLKKCRPDASSPEIGRRVGGRDHSTVLHSVKAWPGRAHRFPNEVAAVEEALRGQP